MLALIQKVRQQTEYSVPTSALEITFNSVSLLGKNNRILKNSMQISITDITSQPSTVAL